MSKLILVPMMVLCLAGCPGMTKQDKVAVACDGVASAAQAVAAAAQAGRVTQAQLDDARRLYHTTDKFCEPVIKDISPMDFAELLTVTADLIKRGE